MRIAALLIALVFSGCANSREHKPKDDVLARIALTVSDTNNKASINQDFTDAADQYLSDVDNILLRMDNTLSKTDERLSRIERRLDSITKLEGLTKLRLMILLQLNDEDLRKTALESFLKELKGEKK